MSGKRKPSKKLSAKNVNSAKRKSTTSNKSSGLRNVKGDPIDAKRNSTSPSVKMSITNEMDIKTNNIISKCSKLQFPNKLPSDVSAIFMSTQSQEIFQCATDKDVTDENPLKLISKDLILKDFYNRAAVSDFSPFKKFINKYTGNELLLMYDPEYAHGQNFIVALTEDAKKELLELITVPEEDENEEVESSQDNYEDYQDLFYIPFEVQPHISLGSEKDMIEEAYKNNRKFISYEMSTIRSNFNQEYEFVDKTVIDNQEMFVEYPHFDNIYFNVQIKLLNNSVQAISEVKDGTVQTNWSLCRNIGVQYYINDITNDKKEKCMNSLEMKAFFKKMFPKFQEILVENRLADVTKDEWSLISSDVEFLSKNDAHLKEFQSFTDLIYTENKAISCIDWHPRYRHVVAVSVVDKSCFDKRVERINKSYATQHIILIWNFYDPIHPQMVLEAPSDVYVFKFCPSNPNIIAAGCRNGTVILWNISKHSDIFVNENKNTTARNSEKLIFEEDETQKIITIKEYVSSNVEASHYLAVTDLQWVPAYFEILRTGLPQSTNSSKCQQLITSSLDGNIFVWNLRSPKKYTSETEENADIYANIKDLNLVWVPILKITCRKCDTNEYLAPTRFSIGPHNSSCEKTFSNLENENEMATLQSKTILLDVNTLIQGGSEDGYIFSIDWIPEKDQETGKPITAKPDFSSSIHDGYVNFCTRSSFFNDIILCVGGWTWSLWKAGTNSGPILKCCAYQYYLKSGCWSQTRPSLFYIARSDGNLEIWDILDRTHEPFSVQNVCSADICYITTKNTSENEEFIALGDSTGTLHIRQIPSSFFKQKQNEFEKTRTYFENEVERRNFVQHRWDLREKEKIEHEIELKRNAGIGANVHLNEDDILANMKVEYNKYLNLELEILRELGLKDDDSILEKDNEEIGKIVQVST